jgi:hypothetical protein
VGIFRQKQKGLNYSRSCGAGGADDIGADARARQCRRVTTMEKSGLPLDRT